MDKITKITGIYPIQLTNALGPEVHISCQGEEIRGALNELRERIYVLESQVNDLTKNYSELQANYWETESKVYDLEDTLSKININLRDNEGNFRSTEVVLNDLAEKWDELDDAQQLSAASALNDSIVKPKQKDDLEIFNQNLQQMLGNIGISAQEAYAALADITEWLGEIK